MLASSTCSLTLGLAPEGEELTMETVMAVCSGSQENEKHIETCNVSMGRGTCGPLGGETNLTTAHSQLLPSIQQELYVQPLRNSTTGNPSFAQQ